MTLRPILHSRYAVSYSLTRHGGTSESVVGGVMSLYGVQPDKQDSDIMR